MPNPLQSLGPVVMMIDDTPFNRRHVQNLLSPFDLNFLEAQNGEQALRELYDLGFQVDLILCDIEMPKMDGIETVKRIRSEAPKIPVVMCSSRSDRESVLACAALGITDFIKKPIDELILLNRLNKYLPNLAKR